MRVLIAPDCFGDSLTAVEAAQAIARGWTSARAADEVTLAPQSDGGPGFVDVLASRLGGRRTARVSGPLTDVVTADYALNALDFVLGTHPGRNTASFASGVGARSMTTVFPLVYPYFSLAKLCNYGCKTRRLT